MIRFIVGTVLALAAFLGGYVIEGGELRLLLGVAAFTTTFFVPFFGVLAVWGFRTWTQAWKHAFKPAPTPQAAHVSVEIWKFSEFACYLAGLLGFLAGSALIFGFWNEGVVANRLPNVAAADLIAPIYGVVFGFVCRILRARVEATNP